MAIQALSNQPNHEVLIDLSLVQKEMATEEKICAICLDALAIAKVRKLKPCKHEFHTECITSWAKIKSVCPLCKGPIEKIPQPFVNTLFSVCDYVNLCMKAMIILPIYCFVEICE